ncbi:hypothetical protein DMB68_02665 [Flavobacterium hydrophilum]|uniref:Uncharacterized protein n=1 Tax=Flavobacterium hydrophilum TaxID=2211445 RepID=A0A2V4C453_9FLAO|nr:hypothetical protein DMB68_02665 [Flavobacterium hydrophilum]
MRLTKQIIGYILLVNGIIRLSLKWYILKRIWEKGFDNSGIEYLFIPILLICIGLLFILYNQKKPAKI